MEMHQIRYFLAVTRTLNFTRAAEECNVAQPSLTRAVKLLEDELGGELFRRERNLTHLTELGIRMQPLLQQCYDSAQSAKSLATSLKTGKIAPLSIALSRTIGMGLIVTQLRELVGAFQGLELRFVRGNSDEIGEALKKGDAEIALAGSLGDNWERLDAWPLFSETISLLVPAVHPFAGRNSVDIQELASERLLQRTYCEQSDMLMQRLKSEGGMSGLSHSVANESDLAALLEANVGVAIAPRSTAIPASAKRLHLNGLEMRRTVSLYAVAGRPRSPAGGMLIKLLRAADWTEFSVHDEASFSKV